jgi:maltokinase
MVPRVDDLAMNLTPLLADYLVRQRWYADDVPPVEVKVTSMEVHGDDPLLIWVLADVTSPTGQTGTYQVVVGGRPVTDLPYFLQGKERVMLGAIDSFVFYDALVDPELALEVLGIVAPDETAELVRPLVVEQSNSSVVYDERLILKLFRRVHPEPNPDVEVTRVLGDQGFPHVVPQRAELRRDGMDLAVVRDYLLASNDAWQLAQTSLRDLLASRMPPDEAGADFGPEAVTLGEVTAALHAALAEAFGTFPATPDTWLADMQAQLERVPADAVDRGRVATRLRDLLAVDDPGVAIRIHGDLHLGQFLQSDTGWFVLDFEGEPDRPLAERVRPSSPLRDVAGMVRSFHYASQAALIEWGRDIDAELGDLAAAWQARAIDAYWTGYHRSAGSSSLLPATEEVQRALLAAFELDKAVYEAGYDLAYRPPWATIPLSAIDRILGRET